MTKEELLAGGGKVVTPTKTGFTKSELLQGGGKLVYSSDAAVNEVQKRIEQPKESHPLETLLKTKDKIFQAGADFQHGIVKGLGSTVSSMESLGEKYLTRPIDRAVEKVTGQKSILPTEGETTGEEIQRQFLQPKNTAESVGKGAEQIAELFTPVGLEEKGATLLAGAAPKAGKLTKAALGLAGKSAGGAVEFGGKTLLQTGDPEQAKEAAAFGAVAPVAEAGIKPILKAGGNAALQILGKSTGAGEAALKEAYNNPNVIKYARKAGGKAGIESLQEQAVNEAKSGLSKIREARGKAYQKSLEGVKAIKSEIDPIVRDTRKKAVEMLDDFGVNVVEGKKLNNFDFEDSVITKGKEQVTKAVNDVMHWTENTPAGLDKLKRRLASHLEEVKDAPGAHQIIKGLRDSVREGLETGVKGYAEMTSGYHQASNLIEELEKTLSLGNKASRDTALKKIMASIRQDNSLRQEMLRTLGKAGGTDVIGKVAGAQLAPLTARGMAGVIEGGAGAVGIGAAVLNPAHIPALLTYLAASSPRLVGEAVSILGKTKGRVITPAMRRGLEALILEAQRTAPEAPAPEAVTP